MHGNSRETEEGTCGRTPHRTTRFPDHLPHWLCSPARLSATLKLMSVDFPRASLIHVIMVGSSAT